MNEKTLERKLREFIKKMGGIAIKLHAISFAGLPDRLVLMPGGHAYFAEIKTTGEKPKKHQLAVHEMLRKLGFMVAVIDSEEALEKFYSDAILDWHYDCVADDDNDNIDEVDEC